MCGGEANPLRWRVGLSAGAFASELRFDDGTPADIEQHAINASLELDLSDRWTLQLAGGAILGGMVSTETMRFSLQPGALATLATSFRALGGERETPFLLLSASVSTSFTSAQPLDVSDPSTAPRVRVTSGDVRVGATVGKTFARVLSPYITARAFGGPIIWQTASRTQTATDQHHFQVGAGLVWAPVPRLNVFAELVPLGERRVSAGLGYAF